MMFPVHEYIKVKWQTTVQEVNCHHSTFGHADQHDKEVWSNLKPKRGRGLLFIVFLGKTCAVVCLLKQLAKQLVRAVPAG